MAVLGYCLGRVAPFYNLALVAVVVILFIRLFLLNPKKVYLKPWKLLFAALLVYIGEQTITIVEQAGVIDVSALLFPILEMIIISLFIYLLLLQREYVRK